jgi:hypothetical protein
MVSNSLTSYPHARSYVLKLHSDAAPSAGLIVGRLDHVISGRQFVFHSAEELVACLAQVNQLNASGLPGARS